MYDWSKMKKFKILIPVYNDWESLFKLLEDINKGHRKVEEWANKVGSEIIEINVIRDSFGRKGTAS